MLVSHQVQHNLLGGALYATNQTHFSQTQSLSKSAPNLSVISDIWKTNDFESIGDQNRFCRGINQNTRLICCWIRLVYYNKDFGYYSFEYNRILLTIWKTNFEYNKILLTKWKTKTTTCRRIATQSHQQNHPTHSRAKIMLVLDTFALHICIHSLNQ